MTTTNDAPAPASVEAIVQAMESDPFWQDAGLAGTTQQDQRIRHYAEVALAALSPPPTVGAPAPSGSGVREALRNRSLALRVGLASGRKGLRIYDATLDGQAADEIDRLHAELASLASDASPRGEAWKAGQTVKLSVDVGYASPEAPFALAAHPAPATVEMTCDQMLAEAGRLAGEIGYMVVPDPVLADGKVHAPEFVLQVQPSLRALGFHAVPLDAALAPATEGRKG